jgi:hypothetical protein
LQLAHVREFRLAATARAVWYRVTRVIDHVIFFFFAIGIEAEPLQLVGGFGGGRLEVFEEVDEGGYALFSWDPVFTRVSTNLPARRS